MRFDSPLIPAVLIRRYKRFLADVRLADGREVIVHCPNPGNMATLAIPNSKIWLEPNDDPKRKLNYGWRLNQEPGGFVGIDTSLPNKLVAEALAARQIPALTDYAQTRAEMPFGQGSRVDFFLSDGAGPDAYVEVKSVTLLRQTGLAEFPGSVTKRGAKHLAELAAMAAAGHRAVILYVIQRTDVTHATVAADIDPAYAKAMANARAAGVETLCYDCVITPEQVTLGKEIPFI